MEPNFQTSFIPKKPIVEQRASLSRSTISLSSIIVIFIFFAVLVGTGSLYFYKSFLVKQKQSMEEGLQLAKDRFEPSKIVQLQVLDRRLRASNEVLSNHVAISPIFKALQDITMKTISYNKFTYSLSTEDNPKISVKMSGVAIGYRSIALQSDLFNENKYFIDPIFSNLSLDDDGNVLFDLDFVVDPNFIDYKKVLDSSNNQDMLN